ncbi:hypothetical protein HanHA89_Chr13g0536851 [Helianthus annuus]|nr:hypothetical protein HanHA89_Chr13g0536851 [Helianthus annuus]
MALHDGDGRRPPECLATGLGFRRVWRRGWCLPAMVVVQNAIKHSGDVGECVRESKLLERERD